MKKFIVNSFKAFNWRSIIVPGVILSLELLISALISKKQEKYTRYSEHSNPRIM